MKNIRKIKSDLTKLSVTPFDPYQLDKLDGVAQSVVNLISKIGIGHDLEEGAIYSEAINYVCQKLQERIQNGSIFR
jgi:hypothetical protein